MISYFCNEGGRVQLTNNSDKEKFHPETEHLARISTCEDINIQTPGAKELISISSHHKLDLVY